MAQKLLRYRALNVSQWIIQRPLKPMDYENTLTYATPILTQQQKYAWPIQHKDDH